MFRPKRHFSFKKFKHKCNWTALITPKMVLQCSRATSDYSASVFIRADSMEKSERIYRHLRHTTQWRLLWWIRPSAQRVHDEGSESAPRAKNNTSNVTHTTHRFTELHREHTGGYKHGGAGEESSRSAGGKPRSHRSVSHQRAGGTDGHMSGRGHPRHGGHFHGWENP